jgi:hypothetical protein
MKSFCAVLFFLLISLSSFSQKDSLDIDAKYLEDQLFFAVSYNTLFDSSVNLEENGFSFGMSTGFMKDIPLNSARNFGLGIGVGYSFNSYINNLVVSSNEIPTYSLSTPYEKNTFYTHSLDIPIELRWRTSTPTNYKFLRVYGGSVISFLYKDKYNFVDVSGFLTSQNIPNINKTQVALALNIGYGTWNFFVNYYLTPFFTPSTTLDTGSKLNSRAVRLGLIFYLL